MKNLLIAIALTAVCIAHAQTPPRGENLLANPSFEKTHRALAADWQPFVRGYTLARGNAYDGQVAILCESDSPTAAYGAVQRIVFDPPVRQRFRVAGWSKAENVQGRDYCLYVDCWYDDGTNLWGQRADFRNGTHDWHYAELTFEAEKPIARVEVYAMFRNCTGRAWFDDLQFSITPLEVVWEQASPGLYGGNSIDYAARLSLPSDWVALVLRRGRAVYSTTGHGTGVSLSWAGIDERDQLLPGGPYTIRLLATEAGEKEPMRHDVPVTTPSGSSRGYAAWTHSAMERVLVDAVPVNPAAPLTASIALAGNEWESFQVALRTAAERTLQDCTVQISDLHGPGGAVIDASHVQWQQVGFVELTRLFQYSRVRNALPGWWPDPLLPVSKFSVPGGTTQGLWFTVYAPAGTPAGQYRGQVTITPANAEPVQVQVEALVYDFDLPVQPELKTAFSVMDGFLEKIYRTPTTRLRRAYGDFMLSHRLNPTDISRTDMPDIDDVAYYYNRGLNAFNVINIIEPRGKRTWVWQSVPSIYTPQFNAALMSRLDPYVAELKRRGMLDKAYIYGFDEVEDQYRPIVKEYFGMVKQRYGIPTLTTALVPIDPQVLKELNIDWACYITSKYDLAKSDACRRAGHQVWTYVASVPRAPHANWLADDPLIEARILGWQAYHQRFDGMLYWGANMWQWANNDHIIRPEEDGPRLKWGITTGTSGWRGQTNGDGVLIYPGPDGPIGSIRLAAIRDGIEDYEYLHMLARLEGNTEKARQACLPVTQGLTAYTHDPEALYAQRHQIARRIEQLLGERRRP